MSNQDKIDAATAPSEILARILNPNEAKTEIEWVCADEITRLKEEVARMREALKMHACDCTFAAQCAVPTKCRNYLARAALTPSQEPRT